MQGDPLTVTLFRHTTQSVLQVYPQHPGALFQSHIDDMCILGQPKNAQKDLRAVKSAFGAIGLKPVSASSPPNRYNANPVTGKIPGFPQKPDSNFCVDVPDGMTDQAPTEPCGCVAPGCPAQQAALHEVESKEQHEKKGKGKTKKKKKKKK